MSYIYKITNKVNGKIYIGQTSLSPELRFKEHIQDSKKEKLKYRPLYRAMNKYGINNFYLEIVEECSSDEVNEREIYWIDKYNSFGLGYNVTKGGEGKLLYDHQAILKELQKNPFRKEVAEKFGCSPDLVTKIAKSYNITLLSKSVEKMKEKRKKVHQYDKNNNFIQSFSSVTEAAKWCFDNQKTTKLTSGVRSHIAEVANNKRKSAYGYIWKYDS